MSVVDWEQLPDAVLEHVRMNTCLISIMLANNETGLMFSVAQASRSVVQGNRSVTASILELVYMIFIQFKMYFVY